MHSGIYLPSDFNTSIVEYFITQKYHEDIVGEMNINIHLVSISQNVTNLLPQAKEKDAQHESVHSDMFFIGLQSLANM